MWRRVTALGRLGPTGGSGGTCLHTWARQVVALTLSCAAGPDTWSMGTPAHAPPIGLTCALKGLHCHLWGLSCLLGNSAVPFETNSRPVASVSLNAACRHTNGADLSRSAPFARAGEDGGIPARWQGCGVFGWCGGNPAANVSTCRPGSERRRSFRPWRPGRPGRSPAPHADRSWSGRSRRPEPRAASARRRVGRRASCRPS